MKSKSAENSYSSEYEIGIIGDSIEVQQNSAKTVNSKEHLFVARKCTRASLYEKQMKGESPETSKSKCFADIAIKRSKSDLNLTPSTSKCESALHNTDQPRMYKSSQEGNIFYKFCRRSIRKLSRVGK
jgi:hypothetical protein